MKLDFIDLNNKLKSAEMPKPAGFEKNNVNFEATQSNADKLKLIQNKAWQIAVSPMSSIFMNFILFYFVGGSLNIYTLIMIFTLIINQLKSLIGINEKFKEFEPYKMQEITFYKFIYFCINAALLGYSSYKLYHMGLLPLSPADYIDLLPGVPHPEKVVLVKE